MPYRSLASQDEFVSANETQADSWLIRRCTWMFSAPYLEAWAIWALWLIIIVNAGFILFQQPAEYWINYKNALGDQPFLSTSPFLFLGAYLLYLGLIGFLLSVVNRKVGMFAWILISLCHLDSIADLSWLGLRPLFLLTDDSQRSSFHLGMIAVEGLGWGIILVTLVSILTSEKDKAIHKPGRTWALGVCGLVLIFLLSAGIIHMVTLPRSRWHQVQTVHTPPTRAWATAAYDPVHKVAILFGGTNSWNNVGWIGEEDTWEWNGKDWIKLSPAHSPSGRFHATMAYDDAQGTIILFGGQNLTQVYGDTWEWDGTDWHQLSPPVSPPARTEAGSFYDPVRKQIILYGGFTNQTGTGASENGNDANKYLDDIWVWNSTTWQEIKLAKTHESDLNTMAFDSSSQMDMIMDGVGLWLWEPEGLIEKQVPNGPAARWDSQMAVDYQRNNTVLFGGSNNNQLLGDTWLYTAEKWEKIETTNVPSPRSGFSLFYDIGRKSFILFGGNNDQSRLNDTWELVLP